MRRPAFALAVLLLTLVYAGAAFAARGDPKKALTKVDQARAEAMLLTRADLAPSFRSSPSSNDDSGAYCKALDESDLTLSGEAESPYFQQAVGGVTAISVSSVAQVYRSRREADTSWRRGTSRAGERCAKTILTRLLGQTGARVLSFSRVAFPSLAQRSLRYRLTASVTGQGLGPGSAVKLFFDVVVLQHSRAHVSLLFFTLERPLARSQEVALAGLAARRMAAALPIG